jgi:hypothetical protein
MKLILCYPSSDEGKKAASMFKWLMRKNTTDIELELIKDELGNLELLIEPINRHISGNKYVTAYDNIRSALHSIFPDLIDPTVIKRKSMIDYDTRKKSGIGPNSSSNKSNWVDYHVR